VISAARPTFRWLAIALAAASAAAALALFIAGAIGGTGNADRYGRVAVPGDGVFELPAGDVALFYEERVTLSENDSLDVPAGLRVTARREVTVSSRNTVTNAINLDGRSLREFAVLEIPQEGRYRVSARADAPGGNTPAVTFGDGLGAAMLDAGKRAGIALGAGVGTALLVLLAGRVGYTPEPKWRVVGPGPPPGPPPS